MNLLLELLKPNKITFSNRRLEVFVTTLSGSSIHRFLLLIETVKEWVYNLRFTNAGSRCAVTLATGSKICTIWPIWRSIAYTLHSFRGRKNTSRSVPCLHSMCVKQQVHATLIPAPYYSKLWHVRGIIFHDLQFQKLRLPTSTIPQLDSVSFNGDSVPPKISTRVSVLSPFCLEDRVVTFYSALEGMYYWSNINKNSQREPNPTRIKPVWQSEKCTPFLIDCQFDSTRWADQ